MRGFILLGCLALAVQTAWAEIDVDFTVDTETTLHQISPLIYGANGQALETATARRIGGNRLTGYNWENNASHAGADWYHQNDNYMPWIMGIDPSQYEEPGIVLTTFHDISLAHNAYSLITLQMAGYAARDKDGVVDESETAPSPRWTEVINRKPGAFAHPPDTADGGLYIDEMLNYLLETYGSGAGPTGIKAYALDNEPALWPYTHPRIFPEALTVAELLERSIGLSHTIKSMDPTAETFGPCLYGFNAFYNLQNAPDWNEYSGNYNRFIETYLDYMRAASDTAGMRLLDVLDVHWYPEPSGVYSGDTTRAVAEVRMQVTRSLWDSTYVEPSWIGQWFSPVRIIPYLQGAIDNYYPDTKLAVTEYDYGAPDHISGGLAQVDALGIFGRYRLYFASKWGAVSEYIEAAYKLYRDGDGAGMCFGDQCLPAATSDIENSAIYAAHAGTDSLHLILINRNYDEVMAGHFTLDGAAAYSHGESWAITRSDTLIHSGAAVEIADGRTFDFSLPPLSAHHLVLHRESSDVVTSDPLRAVPTGISIQPHPVRSILHLAYPEEISCAGRVSIHDISGRKLREVSNPTGINPLVIDDLALAPGTYFLRVVAGDRRFTRKLVMAE